MRLYVKKILQVLTSTFSSADKRGPGGPSATFSRPGEQYTNVVLSVWIQVPELVGKHVHSIDLRPRCMACSVFNLSANDGPITQDGVGVELDDQVCGTRSQELRWSNGRWGHWEKSNRQKVGYWTILYKQTLHKKVPGGHNVWAQNLPAVRQHIQF